MELIIFYSNLAAVIRALRTRAGLTQEQLASRAGLTRRYIQSIENEKQEATLSTIFIIAAALEISPTQIVSEIEHALANGSLSESICKTLPPKKIGRPLKANSIDAPLTQRKKGGDL